MSDHMPLQHRWLLLEVAGFLSLISQGVTVPNVQEHASQLLDKVGKALADADTGVE